MSSVPPPANLITPYTQWSLFCNTEDTTVYGWLPSSNPEPTTCFTNASHSINSNSIQPIQSIGPPSTSIVQDQNGVTKGRFRFKGYQLAGIATGTTGTLVITFSYPVAVKQVMLVTNANQSGDIINCWRYYQTPVPGGAALTQPVNIGDTVINLNANFIFGPAAVPGIRFVLNDGTNIFDFGDIVSVNISALTITVSNASTFAFATTATVEFSVAIAENLMIGPEGQYAFGRETQGSSYFSPGSFMYCSIYE